MNLFSTIKNITLVCLLISIFSSCQTTPEIKNINLFKDIEWHLGDNLIFRNDSAICFTKYDTINNISTDIQSFPLNISDTTLIYTRFQKRGYFDNNRDFKVTHLEKQVDTVWYDLKRINKQPKLILYTNPFPSILNTKSEINIVETNNLTQIKFVIAKYSIGDLIDRSLLKTRGIYNYPNYTIEDCESANNKDITYKIIGYNTIYSIERRRIEDYRIKEIVEVVTSKLNTKPEYRPMRQWIDGSDYEYEFYRWIGHGVQINLSRSKYIGSNSYKTLVGNNEWTLSYDDSFIQAILVETYRNGKPQSSIIN